MQPAGDDLLVVRDGVDGVADAQVVDPRERAHPADQLGQPGFLVTGHRAAGGRDPRGGEHAVADGLAVPEATVLRQGLEGVADRVAEVQRPPRTGLAFVGHHDTRLDGAALGHDVGQDADVAGEDAFEFRFEPREERGRRDDAVLDDLVQTGTELPSRQRREHLGIAGDECGRMERADEVLARRQVHADLAPDRAVHLREQRRRDLDEADAPKVARRRESDDVADDAAADGDDRTGSIESLRLAGGIEAGDRAEGLGALAVGNQDRTSAWREQAREAAAVEVPDGRGAHDEPLPADVLVREPSGQRAGQAGADQDGVGVAFARDVDADWCHDGTRGAGATARASPAC